MTRRCDVCGETFEAPADLATCPYCASALRIVTTEPIVRPTPIPELSPTVTEDVGSVRPTTLEPEAELPAGALIGQYRIEAKIGRGGMGAVYRAIHVHLNRPVALKVLPPKLAKDPEFVRRFKREANALARLSHPSIVAIHDMGIQGELYYFVMELVDGVNLRQVFQTKTLTPGLALTMVPKLCDALEYAHGQGVVHRDIKPENILVDKKGNPKIADFGLAKILRGDQPQTVLTATNVVMGTADYMAPEQRSRTSEVDHRADIYSLGVVVYEMLTGELPVGRFPAPSKRVQIDVRIDGVVLRALEHEPDQRYQRASELGQEVTRITTGISAAAPAKGLDFGRCLNDALSVWREHWGKLAGVVLVSNLLSFATLGILSGAMGGGVLLLCLRALRRPNRAVVFDDLFGAMNRWCALLVALILVMAGVLLGLVLCIVPAVLLGTYWMFAMYFIVDRRRGPVEALGDSWRLVKERGFGQCFLLFLVTMLIMLGPSAIPYVGPILGIFITPLATLMIASAWIQFTGSGVPAASPVAEVAGEPERKPKRRWLTAVVVIAACVVGLACAASCGMAIVLPAILRVERVKQEILARELAARSRPQSVVEPALTPAPEGAVWLQRISADQAHAMAVAGGTVVVNSDPIEFLDLRTGMIFARVRATGESTHSVPAVAGDRVVLGTEEGVLAFRVSQGHVEPLWAWAAEAEVQAPPLIEGDRVYVGTAAKRFVALDLETGRKVWDHPTQEPPGEGAAAFGQFVMFAEGSRVHFLGTYARSVAVMHDFVDASPVGPPAVVGDRAWVLVKPLGRPERLVEFLWDGSRGREVALGEETSPSPGPFAIGGRVVVPLDAIHVVDPARGEVVATASVGARPQGVTAAREWIAAVKRDGEVVLVDPATGSVAARARGAALAEDPVAVFADPYLVVLEPGVPQVRAIDLTPLFQEAGGF